MPVSRGLSITIWRALALAAVLLALAACGAKDDPPALPSVHARLDQTSVSGISSGAYMAGQFQLAHSRIVIGAAIIAGGPYGCAESVFADVMSGPGMAFINLAKAANGCMRNGLQIWGTPNPKILAARAGQLAARGRIDPIGKLAGDRVYLFTGKKDRTVVPQIVAAAAAFYKQLGFTRQQIKFVSSDKSGHGFITEDEGRSCGSSAPPFINDCDYDQAGALLEHIYGRLNPRARRPAGVFLDFDQTAFTAGLKNHGLAGRGIVYIPPDCRANKGCRIHIAFHGCRQSAQSIGTDFARKSGFARWADANRLVILFPQASKSTLNPQGCWDWWGYTGRDYLTRSAPQIMAVRRMIDRLAGISPAT